MATYGAIAYTPSVRAAQVRMGSPVARSSEDAEARFHLGPAETAFITASDGFFQATTSETGWPYVQFRGGPPGFVQVLADHQIGYADLRGNRQYISVGNLSHDDRVALFFIDFASQRRLKLYGHAAVIEEGPVVERLAANADEGRVERAVVIDLVAAVWNCRQHIAPMWRAEEVEHAMRTLQTRIEELELQIAASAR
jgi:predicted pyridoxine 5'-phosphate oxidase superfamily flavin-nucleotide-binding protein